MRESIARVWFGVLNGAALYIFPGTSYIDRYILCILPIERQTVSVLTKYVAVISIIKDDDYAQAVDAVAVKEACKDLIDEHLLPYGIALPIRVSRQMMIPAMSEGTELEICEGASLMGFGTHPNLNRWKSEPVSTVIA